MRAPFAHAPATLPSAVPAGAGLVVIPAGRSRSNHAEVARSLGTAIIAGRYPAGAKLPGDGELLARVFENLLTNAARYGKDGQFIDVRCAVESGEAIVQVVNYGQAIPEDELRAVDEAMGPWHRSSTCRVFDLVRDS